MTRAFLHEAEVQRAALGAERLQAAVITHPLSTLTDDDIAARAAEAARQVADILTGGAAPV